eukprot:COSAG02_NODE_15140_length_1200_cov_1.434151_2_plen_78_part_01
MRHAQHEAAETEAAGGDDQKSSEGSIQNQLACKAESVEPNRAALAPTCPGGVELLSPPPSRQDGALPPPRALGIRPPF